MKDIPVGLQEAKFTFSVNFAVHIHVYIAFEPFLIPDWQELYLKSAREARHDLTKYSNMMYNSAQNLDL